MRDFNPRPNVRPDAFEFAGATDGRSVVPARPRSPFNNADEMGLALELLQVTNEAELERSLRELFKKAWRGIEPVEAKVIAPLGVLLKTVARKALPSVATGAGTAFGKPRDDAIAGNLGSLVSQALEAEAAGMTATDRDVEQCRQLLEKYLRFVRFAGKAAMAAASAPAGVNPIAAAKRSLVDSANEKLARRPASAGLTATFAEGVPATAVMKAAPAVGRAAGQTSRTRAKAPGECICSVCELPPGSCQCGKIGRSGRWFRSGSSIIVNC